MLVNRDELISGIGKTTRAIISVVGEFGHPGDIAIREHGVGMQVAIPV